MTWWISLRGTGKLPVLFVVALFILFTVIKDGNSKKNGDEEGGEKSSLPDLREPLEDELLPGYLMKAPQRLFCFILSLWTGVSYGLTVLMEKGFLSVKKEERKEKKQVLLKAGHNALILFLVVITLILGGKRIIAGEFYNKAENTLHIRTKYVIAMDALLSLGKDESVIEVIAPPEITPYLKPYSSKFMPFYEYGRNGDNSGLSENERSVYGEFQTSVPDIKRITDIGHEEGIEYILMDTGNYYPEFKASEFGYELLASIDTWEIYRLAADSD